MLNAEFPRSAERIHNKINFEFNTKVVRQPVKIGKHRTDVVFSSYDYHCTGLISIQMGLIKFLVLLLRLAYNDVGCKLLSLSFARTICELT